MVGELGLRGSEIADQGPLPTAEQEEGFSFLIPA